LAAELIAGEVRRQRRAGDLELSAVTLSALGSLNDLYGKYLNPANCPVIIPAAAPPPTLKPATYNSNTAMYASKIAVTRNVWLSGVLE
jgi:hypothetical protein